MQESLANYTQSFGPLRTGLRIERERDPNDISLERVYCILRRRKRPLFVCVALSIVLGMAYCVIAPRRYEATGRVVINTETSNALGLSTGAAALPFQDGSLIQETQVRILQSDSIAWDVIRQLRLDRTAEFGLAGTQAAHASDPLVRQTILANFRGRLRVRSVPKTQIVEVSFRSCDPQLAANVVNSIAAVYVERSFRARFDATQQASDWLTVQLDDLKKNVENKQEEFVEFQKKTGIVGTDETHNIVVSRLDELNKHLASAEAERIIREARYRQALSAAPEVLLEMAPTSGLPILRTQEKGLQVDLAQLTAKYGGAYPKVMQVRAELAQVQGSLAAETNSVRQRLEAEYRASVKAETMASAEVDRQKQEAHKLNQAGIQYLILKREWEGSRELYEDLQRKLKEAGVVAGLRSTNINVVDSADIPARPAEPRIPLAIMLATLLGGAFGVALAFALDSLDKTVTDPEMAERLAQVPVIGVVPHVEKNRMKDEGAGDPAYLFQPPQSPFAEAFRVLRSTLLLSSPTAPQVFAVTSALPGEGKTVTSINLAYALAQSGRKVLLVDGDLRRNRLHRLLGLPDHSGLSRLLRDDTEAGILNVPELPSLDVLPAGDSQGVPAELLESPRMKALVDSWRERYDNVVIDTTPVLGLSDALVLAALSDAVLLVTRHNFTQRQSLCRMRDCLARVAVHPVGIVFNDLDADSSPHYDYYGYYGRSYRRYYAGIKPDTRVN